MASLLLMAVGMTDLEREEFLEEEKYRKGFVVYFVLRAANGILWLLVGCIVELVSLPGDVEVKRIGLVEREGRLLSCLNLVFPTLK